jgi:AraC-like DNA-binding protein
VLDVPYRELAPPPDLAAHVDRFWVRRTTRDAPGLHRVLPDGCVDLMVDAREGTAHAVGTMSRALVVPSHAAHVVAARLRPGVARVILGRPVDALTDLRVDAGDLGLRLDVVIEEAMRVPLFEPAIASLVAWLRHRLAGARPDRLVARAVVRLSRGAHGSIADLARELGVSRQHLARRFQAEVGVGPKELARIARMQRVVGAITTGSGELARLAVDHGYVDQSHLTHELDSLVGLTPSQLRGEGEPVLALPHLFVG